MTTSIPQFLPRLRALQLAAQAYTGADVAPHVAIDYSLALHTGRAADDLDSLWSVYVAGIAPQFFRAATLDDAMILAEHAVTRSEPAPLPTIEN